MIVLVGAKGNSLGSRIDTMLRRDGAHEWHDIVATDIEDFDATNFSEVEHYFNSIIASDLKVVDFVGIMRNARIYEENLPSFEHTMMVNAGSLFNISKVLFPIFKQQSGGRLIHMGSNAAVQGFSGMLSYCASKFATRGMIQVIAKEYAKIGAVANQINPCAFAPESSGMSNNQIEGFMDTQSMEKDEVLKMMVSRIPAGRLATLDDLYSIVKFLLFNSTDYINGQSFNLSGGMHM